VTIASSEIERIVLMNACEDYAPLWQILGEIRELRPEEGEEAARRETRRAVVAMIERGLLEVYRRESRASAFARLDGPERDAALAADAYWAADAKDAVEISLAATKAGESAYRTAP
jgi:transposase InsO family protein